MIDFMTFKEQLPVHWNHTYTEFLKLLNAPISHPEMWWIIAPLIFTFLVMTFYFGVYRKEEMGYNTALGNTIVLFFVIIDLLRTMFYYSSPPTWINYTLHPIKMGVLFAVFIESVFLFFSAFSHFLPKRLMYLVASPASVNLQAYVLLALVYTKAEPNWYTLSAAVFFFILLLAFTSIVHLIQYLYFLRSHHSKKAYADKLRDQAKGLRERAQNANWLSKKWTEHEADSLIEEAEKLEKELGKEDTAHFGAQKESKPKSPPKKTPKKAKSSKKKK